jgi:hypothetical protein
LWCLLALIFFWSCRRDVPSNFDRNLPPETMLTGAPVESSLTFYQVHLKWYGVDPDGVVDYYEYSVTDTNKTPGEDDPGFSGFLKTTKTDSVFLLQANMVQTLGHRFYVRAVDNEGKTDPTPAWTYFVADDFNLPGVEFLSASGTWVTRRGVDTTVALSSNSNFAPTDTIGVGGVFRASWTGTDADSVTGGEVVGYEYRRSTDPEFTGGTRADTTATFSFARPAGSELSSYFSGVAAILVRSIDDAGAKTNPDSLRSVVVNFSPRAWIVDPNQTNPPVRAYPALFIERESQVIYPSGTTLADGLRRIQFKYTGFDDQRDLRLDPNNPSGVTGFQYRRLKGGGGVAYLDIASWKPYPLVSDFDDGQNLTSGDYTYLIRARDELGREGAPETLRVSVNYFPFFTSATYVDQSMVEQPLWNPGPSGQQADTVLVPIPAAGGGGYPGLTVRFFARDDHDPLSPHPMDFNDLVEQEVSRVGSYQSLLNGSRESFLPAPTDSLGQPTADERTYPVSPLGGAGIVADGLNVLVLKAKDLTGRVTTLQVVFRAELQ